MIVSYKNEQTKKNSYNLAVFLFRFRLFHFTGAPIYGKIIENKTGKPLKNGGETIMTKHATCPLCGGALKINPEEGLAVCDACGEKTEADAADLRRIREVCAGAERLMRHRTAATYREAVRQLKSIAPIADVQSTIDYCEAQLAAMREDDWRREIRTKDSDKNHSALGIVLAVAAGIVVLALISGIIALCIQWSRGTLSKTTVTVVICIAAAIVLLSVFGKTKRSR